MARKSKDKPIGSVDLLKPLNLDSFQEDGTCFGKLWDNTTVECSRCTFNIVCGIVTQKTNKAKEKQIEQAGAKFLDTASFDKMDITELEKYAKQGGDTRGLVDLVKQLSGMQDEGAVINYLKVFIGNHPNISTKGGVVLWK